MDPIPRPHVKFIDSLWTFAVAVAFTGPLALPLLWRNPRFGRRTKIVVTLLVIALTVGLILLMGQITSLMMKQIGELQL